MKKIFIILSLFTALQLQAQEQNNYMTNDEIQSFLDSMIVHKDQIVGKKMGDIYNLFDLARVPLRHFSYEGTSCWIDPDGNSYLESAILFTETLEDMDEGKEYFDIRFDLDIPKLEMREFEDSMPSNTWEIFWISFKQRTQDMEIKDFSYQRLILPLHN